MSKQYVMGNGAIALGALSAGVNLVSGYPGIVQLSHPYMTTGKTIALTTWTSVGKVMSMVDRKSTRLNSSHSV